MSRRMRVIIQTERASMAGGHTQPRASSPPGPKAMRLSPPRPIKTAGVHAQRWGWSVKRSERAARIAQPRAKPQSTAPVSSLGSGGMKGITARTPAARSPLVREARTIRLRRPFGCCEGGCWFERVRCVRRGVSRCEVPTTWVTVGESRRPVSPVDGEAAISNTLPSLALWARAAGVWAAGSRSGSVGGLAWFCPGAVRSGQCREGGAASAR